MRATIECQANGNVGIGTSGAQADLHVQEPDATVLIEADTGLRPAFAMEAFASLEGDVRQSMARIRASPFIPHKDQVRGFVYDCATGRLNEVSPA